MSADPNLLLFGVNQLYGWDCVEEQLWLPSFPQSRTILLVQEMKLSVSSWCGLQDCHVAGQFHIASTSGAEELCPYGGAQK